jgi:hypothetical protein
MAMAARRLRPGIFLILRQNRAQNRALFAALDADMTMVPSEIIANECIACLRARHLSAFLAIVYARDNAWAAALTERLQPVIGSRSPEVWNCALEPSEAPGLLDAMSRAPAPARLDDLRRDIADRDARLPCVALVLARDGAIVDLPPESIELRPGDDLLFAGRERARTGMLQSMRNTNAAEYVLTGRDRGAGLLGRLLSPPDVPEPRRTATRAPQNGH